MSEIDDTAQFLKVPPDDVLAWQSKNAPIPTDCNDVGQLHLLVQWLAKQYKTPVNSDNPQFSQRILDVGFCTGLAFCLLAFVAVVAFLFYFIGVSANSLNVNHTGKENIATSSFELISRLMAIKMALLSCGVMSSVGLAFLGVSLFLVGVRSVMNASAADETRKLELVSIAPGTLVLLCSAILIGICTTRDFSITRSQIGSITEAGKDSPSADITPIQNKNGTFECFKFNGLIDLVTSLRKTVVDAETQPENEQLQSLKLVWYSASNMAILAKESETFLESNPTAVPLLVSRLKDINIHLNEISKAESDFGAHTKETLQEMKRQLSLLEAALKTNLPK